MGYSGWCRRSESAPTRKAVNVEYVDDKVVERIVFVNDANYRQEKVCFCNWELALIWFGELLLPISESCLYWVPCA